MCLCVLPMSAECIEGHLRTSGFLSGLSPAHGPSLHPHLSNCKIGKRIVLGTQSVRSFSTLGDWVGWCLCGMCIECLLYELRIGSTGR